jgi:hypothetical protein
MAAGSRIDTLDTPEEGRLLAGELDAPAKDDLSEVARRPGVSRPDRSVMGDFSSSYHHILIPLH